MAGDGAGVAGTDEFKRHQQRLIDAKGRGAEEMTRAVIDDLAGLQYRVGREEATRADIEATIASIKTDLGAAQAVAAQARAEAMPQGDESDAVRSYAEFNQDRLRRSEIVEVGSGRLSCDTADPAKYLACGSTAIRAFSVVTREGDVIPGYFDDPNPQSEGQRKAQQLMGAWGVINTLRRHSPDHAGLSTTKIRARLQRHLAALPVFGRAFADNALEGAEWQPDRPGANLIAYASMPRVVAGLFPSMMIDGNNLVNPFMTSGLQPFRVGQPSAGDNDPATLRASQLGTSSLAYTAHTLAVNTIANRDATEDSIITFFPVIDAALSVAMIDAREDAILNGDTGTHGDTGITSWSAGGRWGVYGGADDHRRSFIGIRHRALDNSATVSATSQAASTDLFKARGKLTKGFVNQASLAFITSLEYLIYHMLLDPNVLTVDKRGATATVLSGQVASVGGVPVVLSEFYSAELNASGVFDSSTKTKTGGTLVNTTRIVRPMARAARMETTVVPQKHSVYVTGTSREGLVFEAQASEIPCASIINASNDGS